MPPCAKSKASAPLTQEIFGGELQRTLTILADARQRERQENGR